MIFFDKSFMITENKLRKTPNSILYYVASYIFRSLRGLDRVYNLIYGINDSEFTLENKLKGNQLI